MSATMDRFGGVLPTTSARRWTCPTRDTVVHEVFLANSTAVDATVTIVHTPGPNPFDYVNGGSAPQTFTATVPAASAITLPLRLPMIYGGVLTDQASIVGVTATYRGTHNAQWEYLDLHAELRSFIDNAEETMLQLVPPATVETRNPRIGGDILNANTNIGLGILGPVDASSISLGPLTAPTVTVVSAPGSALDGGIGHTWCVSYTFPSGVETLTGPLSPSATVSANQGVQISLPLGPSGTTKRSVYRLQQGERADYAALCFGTARAYAHWVADVPNNTATTFTDTIADATVASGHFPVVGFSTDPTGAHLPTSVDLEIRGMKAIGFTECTMSAQFPAFSPLSMNNTPNVMYDDRYLAFYKKVCDMIRAQGMDPIIECNTMFGGAYGPTPDYSGATWAAFCAKKGIAVQSIIAYCQPTWSNIMAEPATENSIIHFSDIGAAGVTITNATDYINACLPSGFNKGITKVGAGNFPNVANTVTWNTQILAIPAIDGVDLHTFNFDPGTVENIVAIAQAAHAAGKEVWSTETGLFIRRLAERRSVNSQSSTAAYRRDCYAEFFDLQVRFAEVMTELARRCGFSFANFFWTKLMYAVPLPGVVFDPAGNPADRVWYHGKVFDGVNTVPAWSIPYATSSKVLNQLSTAARADPDHPTVNDFGAILQTLAQQQ